jgi:HEAT repeat protein
MLGQAGHPSSRVRFAIAAGLPRLLNPDDVDPEALAVLLSLTEDDNPNVRAHALMGLTYDLELADTIRPLLEAHSDDTDEQIRRHVEEILGGFAHDEAVAINSGPEDVR